MTYDPRIFGSNAGKIISSVEAYIINDTGSTILRLTPVIINSNGTISPVNVSNETALSIAGVSAVNIANGESGEVSFSGRIKNIVTSASLGDVIYIDKSGFITNSKPSDGLNGFTAGDFIIRVGIVVKNESNPAAKDLLVSIILEGQL